MTAAEFFDRFLDYLDSISFPSAKRYRTLIGKLYADIPAAKRKLDKIAKETDTCKQLKLCAELLETIHHAKAIEPDAKRRKLLGDYHSVIVKLMEFLCSGAPAFPSAGKTAPVIKPPTAGKRPYAPPMQGPDPDCGYVRYRQDVPDSLMVPGLCQFLAQEYERIVCFAGQIFGSYADRINRQISVYLSKECPAETHLNDDDYVAKKINELVAKGQTVTGKETAKLLRYETRIDGRFCREAEPHIVIYFRQFKASCWEEYAAAIVKTLAHEYAHYLEFAYCRQYGAEPFRDDRVSEAIADFFGFLYSLYRADTYSIQVAKKRNDAWVRKFGSNWPYAYALLFCQLGSKKMTFSPDLNDYRNFGSIQKLILVFRETPDSSWALTMLRR